MAKNILPFFLFLLVASSPVAAEDLLSKRLSVTFHGTPLKQALDEIAKLAGFEWTYNAKILDTNRRITLIAKDWTVRETLREMLGEQYAFKPSGKYLILKKQTPSKTSLSGVIRDPKTGERLSNVTVYDRKTLRATKTDSSGFYSLKIKNQSEVSIVRLGYRDTTFRVTSLTPRYQKIELSPVQIQVPDTASVPSQLAKSLQKAATELDYFFAATRDKWHDLNIPDTLQRHVQISLLPMIGTNHVLSGKVENEWSFNLLAGQSAGVRRLELAGLGNFTRNRVNGLQAAGLFNVNRGTCTGVQAAGLFNTTADSLHGAQLAGLVNVAHQSKHFSIQAAGLVNIFRKSNDTLVLETTLKGTQLAGLINKANQIEGLQAAGLFNSSEEILGVQAAGLFNTSSEVNGFQVAGFLNTADEVSGAQVSGFMNKAHRIRGIQIGLINTAKEVDGLQIGLLNRSGNRWMPLINWSSRKPSRKVESSE